MESKLRTPKNIKKDPNYLAKEKRILKRLLILALTIILITILINLINYIDVLTSQLPI